MPSRFGILRFHEQYFERIWGGQRLKTLFGKPLPEGKPIGEAWLISDHPSAVSVVRGGPLAGRNLHELVVEDAGALLGRDVKTTPQGRFPLLLKLLDSTDVLSVQVHPNDAKAAAMNEPDVGKTEMWHVLHADPGAELICGVKPGTSPAAFHAAIESGTLEQFLEHFAVQPGDSVFVEAGTVHAIGAGIVLAEIQQNSDLTYRLYDWNRVDASGKGRELHIEKGMAATDFARGKPDKSVKNNVDQLPGDVLAESSYFTARKLSVENRAVQANIERCNIVLSTVGTVVVSTETDKVSLAPGECCLVPACAKDYTVDGHGEVLVYSV